MAGRVEYIVKLLDAVVDDEQQYIVMEYLPGETLEQYCQPEKLLGFDRVVDVIFKCSQALDYASRQGVIHRDIKPANIMFDHEGDIRLADFGASLSLRSTTTQIMGAVGSLAYMAPEQLRGEDVTHKSDIYSLGIVMYQMLTGQLPYQADSEAAFMQKILNEPMPLVRGRRVDVPKSLAAIVQRATEKSLSDRYPTWLEFAQDLSNAVGGLQANSGELDDTRKFGLLRKLAFFDDFSDVELWEAMRIAAWGKLRKDKVLIKEGDIGNSFFVIVKGAVRVLRNSKLIGVLNEGEPFGEMVCVENEPTPRSGTVIADSEMLVVKLRTESLKQASDALQLQFSKALLRVMANRLKTTADLYVKAK